MKRIFCSLIFVLIFCCFSNAQSILKFKKIFEQSEQLDSSYYKAYNELTHHYIKLQSDSCLYYADKLIKDYPDSAFQVAMVFRKRQTISNQLTEIHLISI